jgi:hypothetical protein
MNKDGNRENIWLVIFLGVLMLVFVLIPSWYAARAGAVNGPLLALAKLQIKAFVPLSEEAYTAWEYLCGLDPAALTWERMSAILSYTGKWIRWPLALFLVLLGVTAIFMGRVNKLIRRLNMESLLRHNAESFPCLLPVVGRGKYLLSPESHDAGHWRIARSPLQFAVENGLLVDDAGNAFSPDQVLRHGLGSADAPAWGKARLDEAKTLKILREQLGPVYGGVAALPPCRKALAASFLAYAGGDKKESVALLDDLSRSYAEPDGAACPVLPILEDETFQKRLGAALDKHQGILTEQAIARHTAFELVWFMALLTRARKKGVLASSQFLFLRPLDRSLWYALSQCGGRAAWAEGFAAWAHYTAEEKAGRVLSEPKLQQAVRALRDALAAQGWLTDKPLPIREPEPVPGNPALTPKPQPEAKPEPEPEMVFWDAEPEPGDECDGYDANEDPTIINQSI